MNTDPQILDRLLTALSMESHDARFLLAAALAPAVSAIIFAVTLLVYLRRSRKHAETLDARLKSLESVGQDGPTVRAFCGDLIEALRLRLPKSGIPKVPPHHEAAFIRSLVTHLKVRRIHRLSFERTAEQFVRDVAAMKEELNYLKLRVEAVAQSAADHDALAPLTGGAGVITNATGPTDDEFSAILNDAAASTPNPNDSEFDEESASVEAALPEYGAESTPEGQVDSVPTDTSVNAAPPVAFDERLPAIADADAVIPDDAELSAPADRLESLIEEARSRAGDLDQARELARRATSIADTLAALNERSIESADRSESLIERLDRRMEELDRRNAELRRLIDEVAAIPTTPEALADSKPDPLLAENSIIPPDQTTDAQPLDEFGESFRDEAEKLKNVLVEAVLEEQKLDGIRRNAEDTRSALSSLNESLTGQLSDRQSLLDRIDSQLRERQIQLVTDIMRAQAEHAAVDKALRLASESVSSIQLEIDHTLPSIHSEVPPVESIPETE